MTTKRKSKSKQATAKPKGKTETLDRDNPKDSARVAVDAAINAGLVMHAYSTFGELDVSEAVNEIHEKEISVAKGNMHGMERMLVCQAQALQSIFTRQARLAAAQDHLPKIEALLKLGLRAQNQCRMTLETLATMKNPHPVAFVRQANMGENVQVNNGAPAPARKNENPQNEQLEAPHAKPEWMDAGATRTTAPSNQEVEAVGTVNGAKDKGRQGKRKR